MAGGGGERDGPVMPYPLREFKTKRCRVLAFQTPPSTRLYHGIDWCGGRGVEGAWGIGGKGRRGGGMVCMLAGREAGVEVKAGRGREEGGAKRLWW